MSAAESGASRSERRWLELRVRPPEGDARGELLADALVGLGGRAVEERDGWLLTHLSEPEDPRAFLEEVRRQLRADTGLDDVEVETAWRAHEAWEETWRRGLGPRRITSRILVRPSWTTAQDPDEGIVIVLDPGMAFGTAEHGTTRGCLRLLDRVLRPGDRVLDVGSGSAILAIAAALLGAREVVAIESDPLAWEAMEENVERNGAADRVRLERRAADAAWLALQAPAEGVVANIETGILGPLLPGIRGALGPGGWVILSGILAGEWEGLRATAERHGLSTVDVDADGEWRSGLFRAE